MSRKANRSDNNFRKAVNELPRYPVDEDLNAEAFETGGPQFLNMSDDGEDEETTYSTASSVAPCQSVEAVASAAAPDPIPELVQQKRIPYVIEFAVAADVEIMGNVSSSSNMTISGRIIGNIVCGDSVSIGGEAGGDISAAEMEIWGNVSGNTTAVGKVTICNGAQVKGDIVAHEVITDGTSGGDIKIEGKVVFQTSSVIMGNVYVKTSEMSVGTKIKGLVKTYD